MTESILYVFLDVDGVLNNTAAFKLNNKTMFVLSHENLVAYQYLIDKLKTKYEIRVILSSTWRMGKTGLNKLTKFSRKYNGLVFYGQTSNSHDPRDVEIKRFCDIHKIDYRNILIIDDSSINNELSDRHIKTNECDGLRFSEVINCLQEMFGF